MPDLLCFPARDRSSIQSNLAPAVRWLISLFRSRRVRRSLTASRVNRRVELP